MSKVCVTELLQRIGRVRRGDCSDPTRSTAPGWFGGPLPEWFAYEVVERLHPTLSVGRQRDPTHDHRRRGPGPPARAARLIDRTEPGGTMTYRVVGWSTGGVGRLAIRAIARRPDLELAGVWVHSAEKDGVDAGTLAGIDPLGVAATTDADALLAAQPDCVCYSASGEELDAAAVPDMVRMLEAGINVVTVSTPGLVHPAGYQPELARPARGGRGDAAAPRCTRRASSPASPATSSPLTLMTMSDTVTLGAHPGDLPVRRVPRRVRDVRGVRLRQADGAPGHHGACRACSRARGARRCA